MLELKPMPQTCSQGLKYFYEAKSVLKSEIVAFEGFENKDIYNPSVPFKWNDEEIIVCRVEARDSERSNAVFFKKQQDKWVVRPNSPVFELQDPFVTVIGDELILGGVRVFWENGRIVSWCTDFYKGKSIERLSLFLTGPGDMKDIRLIELADGRVGIFSRPHGDKILERYGCKAMIGFTIENSLSEVTAKSIENAPIIEGQFASGEWGGCNHLQLMNNNRIAIAGHKSREEMIDGQAVLHYYSMAFVFDPITLKMSPCEIICTRDSFPHGPAKQPGLKDVTFTAGLLRNNDGTADIYTGLSDCQIGRATIKDPFLKYEIGY